MWGSWFLIGLLLLITKRYAKKYSVIMHYLHAFLGYFVLVCTLIFAFKLQDWEFSHSPHNAMGTIMIFFTILVTISGSLAAALMRAASPEPWTEKEKSMIVGKIHRFSAYIILLFGNLTVSSGMGHYFGDILDNDWGEDRSWLAGFSTATFAILVVLMEALYRIRNKFALGHIKTPMKIETFTPEQVDKAVEAGKEYVIFDNLVLDLNGYAKVHPGGKFNLLHNLGKDISKFFYGGYNLVNKKFRRPHHHSQAALDMAKSMIVGVIEGQQQVEDVKFRISHK